MLSQTGTSPSNSFDGSVDGFKDRFAGSLRIIRESAGPSTFSQGGANVIPNLLPLLHQKLTLANVVVAFSFGQLALNFIQPSFILPDGLIVKKLIPGRVWIGTHLDSIVGIGLLFALGRREELGSQLDAGDSDPW